MLILNYVYNTQNTINFLWNEKHTNKVILYDVYHIYCDELITRPPSPICQPYAPGVRRIYKGLAKVDFKRVSGVIPSAPDVGFLEVNFTLEEHSCYFLKPGCIVGNKKPVFYNS